MKSMMILVLYIRFEDYERYPKYEDGAYMKKKLKICI